MINLGRGGYVIAAADTWPGRSAPHSLASIAFMRTDYQLPRPANRPALLGSNNADVSQLTDPLKIHHREIGSRLVLAARIFYALL